MAVKLPPVRLEAVGAHFEPVKPLFDVVSVAVFNPTAQS
jgi:hypothetical protein